MPLTSSSSQKQRKPKGQIAKLAIIQIMAAIHITGAMRTSPTDSIEAHANLFPFNLLVFKTIHHSTSRLSCLPPSHLLYKHVRNAAARYVLHH
ncbi:hypothetical protein K439DRAFT_1346638 [Ramaria rubella]|nr:hypothetical protein K439DRAFT_1346638 [Ramaria rubella]